MADAQITASIAMRRFALTVSALGTLLFAGLLALSWLSPLTLERAAREVLRLEVERRVGERIDALSNTRLAELAGKALAQTGADIAQAQERIRRDVPARVASVVADMMNADCECRRRMAARARTQAHERLDGLLRVRERLTGLIESAYGRCATRCCASCASSAAPTPWLSPCWAW